MLKGILDRGKCALGFHVEAWQYSRPGACAQTSLCVRCHSVSERVLHEWPDTWTLAPAEAGHDDGADGRCRLWRRCGRCQEHEFRVEHEWGPPAYAADAACEQIRACVRCDTAMAAGTAHVWVAWTYDAADSCAQTSACSRCGATGAEHRLSHAWADWQESTFYDARVRVCGRCAEMVFDLQAVDSRGDPVSFQQVAGAVAELSSATDLATLRDRVVAHRNVLLTPVTERYLRFARERLPAQSAEREATDAVAQLVERCRDEGIETVFSSPPFAAPVVPPPLPPTDAVTGDAATDRRVTGHWRHTEAMSSGGVSLVTDTHLVLDDSGRFEWWSKSEGTMGSNLSGSERGRWSAASARLQLSFDNGRADTVRYIVEGHSMLWPEEGRYRLWERIAR